MNEQHDVKPMRVAVLGATGQVGTPLAHGLLANGHKVVAITRGRSARNEAKLRALEELGAELAFCEDLSDVDGLAPLLEGCEVLVASVAAEETFLVEVQPKVLEAAIKAGVKRFVPNEFGAHTQGLPMGAGVVFDHKKRFQEKLFASGLDWTLYYNGGIFDYFLPNLRFFEKITTFGDLDLPLYTHHVRDIGAVAALAVVDPRAAKRCVQVDYNVLSQRQMLELLKQCWPDYPFEYQHYSTEYIVRMKEEAGDEVSAKQGAETDKERWGINYVCYVAGKLATFNDITLRATELYPDYQCIKPIEMLQDPTFVFE